MKKLYSLLLLLLCASSVVYGQTSFQVNNDTTTGTTAYETATVNPTTGLAILSATDTTIPAFIVVNGAGITGQATLAASGPASCKMDSTIASAAGLYYVIKSTTAGLCHAQSTAPSANTWLIGYLLSTSTSSGTNALIHVAPQVYGGTGGGMTWPGAAGIMIYAGSNAYGTSLPVSTFLQTANSLSELSGSPGAARGNLGLGAMAVAAGPLFLTNPQTSTYQVLAADFAACKTIPVASGTFTITLVASGAQPANGQCVIVENYGSGVVTIARSGQNINGATSNLTLAAGSATAPTGAFIQSDGTNYEAVLFGSSNGTVNNGTTGHSAYYPSSSAAVSPDPNVDYNQTNALAHTFADTNGIFAASYNSTDTVHNAQSKYTAGSAGNSSCAITSGYDILCYYSSQLSLSHNGGSYSPVAALGNAQSWSAVQTFPGGDLFQGGVNAQTGTSYTVVASDENKLLTFSNASAVAVTLPQATTTGFGSGAVFSLFNKGAGTVTITPTTSTINGAATLTLTTGNGVDIYSDGTNYQVQQNSSSGSSSPTFPVNAQTATYQVLTSDFSSCKTIPVASGTFTITLVASGSQPASGQCIFVVNYGTGVITIARSGQNINGGTTSLTLAAGSATAPTGAFIVSDGTNYEASLLGGSGGTSFSGSQYQTGYFSATNTFVATSAVTVAGSAAASNVGIDQTLPVTQLEVSGPILHDIPYTGTPLFSASCASTVTSPSTCPITGGTNLPPTGIIYASYNTGGGSNYEYICYSAITSTTITPGGGNCPTVGANANGRGLYGTSPQTHNTNDYFVSAVYLVDTSTSTIPIAGILGNAANQLMFFGSPQNSTFSNGINSGVIFGNPIYALGAESWCMIINPSHTNGTCATYANTDLEWTNTNNNAAFVTSGNSLDYSIATQAITATSLTAITNAQTPTFPSNQVAAAAGTGGVLSSHCTIIWQQATGGTVQFGIKASAAAGHIWVKEQDSAGAYLAPTITTLTTSTTATATSGTITPTSLNTNYASDLWIAMDPGTTNSPQIQLQALTSSGSDTLTIEPGTGCTAWQ